MRAVSACTYFSDASALTQYDCVARTQLLRFIQEHRGKLASLVILTWSEGVSPAVRKFSVCAGEPLTILTDPAEFERLLSNVAPAPRRAAKQWQDTFSHEPPSAFR
jgi:hypothetical protein